MVSLYWLQNIRIDADIPKEYFKVLESSVNGSYHRVKTLKRGQVLIDGALTSVVDQVGPIRVNYTGTSLESV